MAYDGGQRRCGRCLVQHGQKCVGHEGRDHRLLLFCQTHGATSSVLLPFSSFIWLAFVYLVIRPSGYLATWLPGCPAAQLPSYPAFVRLLAWPFVGLAFLCAFQGACLCCARCVVDFASFRGGCHTMPRRAPAPSKGSLRRAFRLLGQMGRPRSSSEARVPTAGQIN